MRSILKGVVIGGVLAAGIGSMCVQAAEMDSFGGDLPEALTIYAENINNPECMTIHGFSSEIFQSISDMECMGNMISSPEPAESNFVWNYGNPILNKYYHNILEAADNDGEKDFLIDPYANDGIEVIRVEVETENGETKEVNAIAYKFDHVYGYDTSDVSEMDVLTNAWNMFLKNYNDFGAEFLVTMEELAYLNPEIFWLSGGVYLSVPEIDLEYEEYWDDEFDCYLYEATYEGDFYCLLAIPEIGFDIRHEKYCHSALIKNAINEMNTIVSQVIAGVDGMDEIRKIKYFNEWITTHNELNTVYTTEEEWSELFAKNPDSMNCLGALRGGTGEYAPTPSAYASAYKILCNAADVGCKVIPGKAGIGTEKKMHVWNEVRVFNSYFAVDTAWNDFTDKKNVACSGDESADYLLVGGNASLPVGDEYMTFWATHTAKKDSDIVDNYVAKYSYLGGESYETYGVESFNLIVSDSYVVLGYESLPTITAKKVYTSGEEGELVNSWKVYRYENGKKILAQTYNNSKTTFVFPQNYGPGEYYVQANVTAGAYELNAYIKVTIAQFSDIKEGDWFEESVGWAIENDITAGYTYDTFAPHMNCTRGQLVTFLWRFFDCPKAEKTDSFFKDIVSNAYYYDAVLWASEQGYVKGYTEDMFAPDEKVTRAELATILWRTAKEPVIEVLPKEEKETVEEMTLGFGDVEEDAWYYHAVYWAADNNITKGYSEDVFAPNATATRAEIVTFLYRAKDILAVAE